MQLTGWARALLSLGAAHLRPFSALPGVWAEVARAHRIVDAAFYRSAYPDVAAEGMPPFLHFALFGRQEGRRPAPDAPRAALEHTETQPRPPAWELADRFYDDDDPEVSIVVLNLDRADLTIACLESLWCHTAGHRYEIVVVDNGSRAADFALLARTAGRFRLVRLPTNRFFGEGNNLGAEAARAPLLAFLNNDTLATAGWLEPLVRVLRERPDAGAVGATLLYPDGRVQEAGATVDPSGVAAQRLKGSRERLPPDLVEAVDYCSAAALLVRREAFEAVLGFDLAWEPAYYEDADLCLKLLSAGWRTYYCSASRIVHLEHATAGDPAQALRCGPSLVEINRGKFLARWSGVLAARAAATAPALPAVQAAPPRPVRRGGGKRVGLYTSHPLIPGGGERYLLTMAAAAAHTHEVTLVTDGAYSRLRLLQLGRELGLALDDVAARSVRDLAATDPFDVFVAMDTALLPAIAPRGRRSLFVCQFPFPMTADTVTERWRNLEGYERMLVYSEYAREKTREALGRVALPAAPPVEVLAPPVLLVRGGGVGTRGPLILSVGRFYAGGHPKRHDVLIEAFRAIHQEFPAAELHLAGALHPEAHNRDHLLRLQEKGRGLPVVFHVNVSRPGLEDLYRRASVYWHATGFGSSVRHEPEHMEHFGVSVVEAMSAGCVPVCYAAGGPAEIVSPGETGYLYETAAELRGHTSRLLAAADAPWVGALRRAAVAASGRYEEAVFSERVRALLGG